MSHSVTGSWRESCEKSPQVSDIDREPDQSQKSRTTNQSPGFSASVSPLAGWLCPPRAFKGNTIVIVLHKCTCGKQNSINGEGSFLTCIIFFTKMIKKQNKRKI